jgi:hypothetical protein
MQIGATEIKPTLKASTFASRTSPSTDQSLQKSLLSPPNEKLFLKNSPTLHKNKKRHAQPETNRQIITRTMTAKTQSFSDFQTQWTRTPAANSGFAYSKFVKHPNFMLPLPGFSHIIPAYSQQQTFSILV